MFIAGWAVRSVIAVVSAVLVAAASYSPNASAQVAIDRNPRLIEYDQVVILQCGGYGMIDNCYTTMSYSFNQVNITAITCVMSGAQQSPSSGVSGNMQISANYNVVATADPDGTVNDPYGGHEHIFVFKGPVSRQTISIYLRDFAGYLPRRAFCRISGPLPGRPTTPLLQR